MLALPTQSPVIVIRSTCEIAVVNPHFTQQRPTRANSQARQASQLLHRRNSGIGAILLGGPALALDSRDMAR
jgi:hypothetical protein